MIRHNLHRHARRGLLATLLLACAPALADDYVALPGGEFASVLKLGDSNVQTIEPFELMAQPVSNAQFLRFVQARPEWQRGSAPSIFAGGEYLAHWQAPTQLGAQALPGQPVTQVSWFAAIAYCESQGARLPTWNEWEFAAAASDTEPDARYDPAWRERILSWYSRPSGSALPMVGATAANHYGVHDLHGLVWEWVEDFNALLVSADNRKQGDPDLMAFCGAGALSVEDRENYAVLMRLALLSALDGRSTTRNLGFRCARDLQEIR